MLLRHNLWMYFIVPSLAALLLVFTVFKTRSGFVDKVQDWLGNIYPDTWYFAEQIEKALSLLGGGPSLFHPVASVLTGHHAGFHTCILRTETASA